ncbi:fumarylacetoacetate hydrolase family protein [Falsarthrobacter nasiphocae]|uniref:2-keto-4-pentenoate hydratase/2-oxohepta-3-ene-1,7-dioic acid hydratase in catechol pathway n=1 Tax=Falsarthrobacter nasiphocae TaxID=189863 RepID=A0AAE3YIU3_9MICC|nr:fumarylacetoacetate hydrolase family protein [Falsarthrobacter nasiphocae]MDR6892826.1 2-keto-4-pentenoate hydratase/2-oxohepta-3-ene-1,7-dioic acid hydratase in catechol pathway [Falsarthrobacter nasiphocae]
MRIARFVAPGQDPAYGIVDAEEESLTQIVGDPFFQGVQPTGTVHRLEDVRLLAPVIPRSKVIGIGRNYEDHAAELGNEAPRVSPLMFLKPNTSVVGPGDPVTLPSFSEEISFEAELAVVIGRICKDVPAEKAGDVIFGYTVANDLTARDCQRTDGQWARAKGWDGSCPLGPWIETELDPDDVRVTGELGDELRQDGRTSQMVFSVAELVAFASSAFTLLPGDVILTGTPAGVGLLEEGQSFTAAVEGIGELTNTFRR